MDFFNGIAKGISDFFSGGNNKKKQSSAPKISDEERKRRQRILSQATQSAPVKDAAEQLRPTKKTVRNPGLFMPEEAIPAPAPVDHSGAINFAELGKMLVAGLEQSGGAIADTAIKGGSLVDYAGIKANPLISKEEKARQLADYYAGIVDGGGGATDRLRTGLTNIKDVTGKNIVGTKDVEEAATRIASGKGTAQDMMAVGGKGAQIGLDSTMLFNPARQLAFGLAKPTAKQAAGFVARDAGFFGTTQGVATGTQTYGQTGDVKKALTEGAKAMAMTSAAVGVLGGMSTAAGRTAVAARERLAATPNEIPVAPGVASPNIAKKVKADAEAEAVRAETDLAQMKADTERLIAAADKEIARAEQLTASDGAYYRNPKPSKQAPQNIVDARENTLPPISKDSAEAMMAPGIREVLQNHKPVMPDASMTKAEAKAASKQVTKNANEGMKALKKARESGMDDYEYEAYAKKVVAWAQKEERALMKAKPEKPPKTMAAKVPETPSVVARIGKDGKLEKPKVENAPKPEEDVVRLQARRDSLEQDLRDLKTDGMDTRYVQDELARTNQQLGKLQRSGKLSPEEAAAKEADRRVAEAVKESKAVEASIKSETAPVKATPKKAPVTPVKTVAKESKPPVKATAVPQKPKTVKESVFGKATPEDAGKKMVNKTLRGVGKVKKILREGSSVRQQGSKQLAETTGRALSKQTMTASERTLTVSEINKLVARGETFNAGKELDDAMVRVSQMSDKEVISISKSLRSGLNEGDIPGPARVVEAFSVVGRLGEMAKKAAKTNDTKLANEAADALEEAMYVGTMAPSKGGVNASIAGVMISRATPELLAYRITKKIVDKGGEVTDVQRASILDKLERYQQARADVDQLANDIDGLHAQVDKGKKVSFKDIDKMMEEKFNREAILHQRMGLVNREYSDIIDANAKAGKIDNKIPGQMAASYEAWVKAFMLSAPSGRLRDLAVTLGGTLPDSIVVDTASAMLGKVINTAGNKTRVMDKVFGSRWATKVGNRVGMNKIRDDWTGVSGEQQYLAMGNTNVLDNSSRTRSGINTAYIGKKPRLPLRAVHTATAAPTHLTEAYKSNILYRQGKMAAQKAGLKGDVAEAKARLYVLKAPQEAYAVAEQKMLAVSSMQDNFIGDKATKITENLHKWVSNTKNFKTKSGQRAAQIAVRQADLMTMPFKKFAFGSLARMTGDQLTGVNAVKAIKHGIDGIKAHKLGDTKAVNQSIQQISDDIAREGWNGVKFAGAVMAVTPFLSDTDGNGKSYTPPYIKAGDHYIPLSSLGPILGAPVLYAYAYKKAHEDAAENGAAHASAVYAGTVGAGILTTTGIDNLASGNNALGRLFEGVGEWSGSKDVVKSMSGLASGVAKDATTQWVPALGRDINSAIDLVMGNELAPKTKYEDAEGNKNYFLNAVAPAGSAIPVISQLMPRNEDGKAAAQPLDRLLGSTRKSGELKQEEAKTEEDRLLARDRIANHLNNQDLRGLLDEDTAKLYDQANDPKKSGKLKEDDYKKIAKKISEGATVSYGYQNKLLETEKYEALEKALTIKRSLAEADGKTAPSDLAAIDQELTRVKTYREYHVPHSQIKEYFTTDIEDWRKMNDPDETDWYDIDKYNRIAALDKGLADRVVSRDKDYPDKLYFTDKKKGSGSGGSGSGGKKNSIGTNAGTLTGKTATSPDLKYRGLTAYDSPIPNLAAQTAKTNLKKSITVQKGVRL